MKTFGRVQWWFDESPDACAVSGITISVLFLIFVIAQVRRLCAEYYAPPIPDPIALVIGTELVEPFDIYEEPIEQESENVVEEQAIIAEPEIIPEPMGKTQSPAIPEQAPKIEQIVKPASEPKSSKIPTETKYTHGNQEPVWVVKLHTGIFGYSKFVKVIGYWEIPITEVPWSSASVYSDTNYDDGSLIGSGHFTHYAKEHGVNYPERAIFVGWSDKLRRAVREATEKQGMRHGIDFVTVDVYDNKVEVKRR